MPRKVASVLQKKWGKSTLLHISLSAAGKIKERVFY